MSDVCSSDGKAKVLRNPSTLQNRVLLACAALTGRSCHRKVTAARHRPRA